MMSVVRRNVDLREYLTEEAQASEKSTTYDLVANIVHDGKPTEGSYRIHVLHHVSAVHVCYHIQMLNVEGLCVTSDLCALTGHREVVRAAGPAGDGHPASDDHAVRSIHTGQCRFSSRAASWIKVKLNFLVNVVYQIWKRREADDDGNSYTGA